MPPATASAEFHQIETLAAAQRDFEARHAQLSPGRFRFRMRLADLGPLRIQANAVDGTYLCQARVRPGSWALFFPTGGPVGASRMNGLAQGRADGVLFGPGLCQCAKALSQASSRSQAALEHHHARTRARHRAGTFPGSRLDLRASGRQWYVH
jgi:hypothetical protein